MSRAIDTLINFVWTALAFTPVVMCWWKQPAIFWLCITLLLSLLPFVIPNSVFVDLQLSWHKSFYRRLGIPFFQGLTQKGKLSKKASQLFANKKMNFNKVDVEKLKKEMVGYEMYHYSCLVFFLCSTVYGLILGHYFLSVIILIANLIYNGIPLLIQQYNRVRLA